MRITLKNSRSRVGRRRAEVIVRGHAPRPSAILANHSLGDPQAVPIKIAVIQDVCFGPCDETQHAVSGDARPSLSADQSDVTRDRAFGGGADNGRILADVNTLVRHRPLCLRQLAKCEYARLTGLATQRKRAGQKAVPVESDVKHEDCRAERVANHPVLLPELPPTVFVGRWCLPLKQGQRSDDERPHRVARIERLGVPTVLSRQHGDVAWLVEIKNSFENVERLLEE
jgi:hypothetical protein